MISKQHIAAIVLAAGRSTRMGTFKLLLPLGGRPLAIYAIEAASMSDADPVIVVVGQEADRMHAQLRSDRYKIVYNAEFAQGMATSLRAGVSALPAEVNGALVVLADQPLITATHMNALLTQARQHPDAIIAAAHHNRRGNPVYFPQHLFGELGAITGDEGGRSVISRHADIVQLVEMNDPAVLTDIDQPEEYERLANTWTR